MGVTRVSLTYRKPPYQIWCGNHLIWHKFPSGSLSIYSANLNKTQTKEGFLQTIKSWLEKNNYKYTVASEGSKHDLDQLTLEYIGYWGWDLALYLTNAEITAYHKGQRVGEVQYRAPNSLNLNKFGSAAERIGYMMDILFGERTAQQATTIINSTN